MARDEQHGDLDRSPVDFPEPVGLAWGSNIFDDREAGARAWGIVTRALRGLGSSSVASVDGPALPPAAPKPPER